MQKIFQYRYNFQFYFRDIPPIHTQERNAWFLGFPSSAFLPFSLRNLPRDQEIAAKLPENWHVTSSTHKRIFRGFSHRKSF